MTIRASLDQMIGDALLGEARQKVAQLQNRLRTAWIISCNSS
ncbi:hypothetical protein AEST_11430 [Alishewanella aestuarii B11]|uniref:Uncharacterized protein n=1 Tax=Alishewanella aestuarii B11 TaxID=1197174 RepID=J1QKF3_9ALTE|nr:hypothetical protein AEST_11430 [Alishewanella aestuarii B11]